MSTLASDYALELARNGILVSEIELKTSFDMSMRRMFLEQDPVPMFSNIRVVATVKEAQHTPVETLQATCPPCTSAVLCNGSLPCLHPPEAP